MKKTLLIAIAAALSLTSPLVQAASDYLLEIEGIKGESKDNVHPGTIEIMSFSWGMSNSGAVASGGGGTGKVSMQDFHFTTSISKASPQLMLACATGKHIPKAIFTVRKSGAAGGPVEYYTITLTNILISSVSQAGQTGGTTTTGAGISDTFSLNFQKIEFEYRADDGSVESSGVLQATPAL